MVAVYCIDEHLRIRILLFRSNNHVRETNGIFDYQAIKNSF
jgi:hypothetical protein